MFSIFSGRNSIDKLEQKRVKNSQKTGGIPCLKALYQTPLPFAKTPLKDIHFVVIDIETTGLDPTTDHILSMGYVEIYQQKVLINQSKHIYIASVNNIKPQTAIINHIVPEDLYSGIPLSKVLCDVLPLFAGKVIVAHGASIEYNFIKQALISMQHSLELPFIWVDTLQLEKSLTINKGPEERDFRLSEIRRRYQLPDYVAHNAMGDAIATAELFLVQLKQLFGQEAGNLEELYKYCCKG